MSPLIPHPDRTEDKRPGLFDLNHLIKVIIDRWYFIVFSVVICASIAFFKIRYAERVYPIKASIIIHEKEETNGIDLLYKNGLIDQYRNYLNEPYVIKSYPLIQRVIEELNFNVTVSKEGRIKTTELYQSAPFFIKIVSDSSADVPLNFRLRFDGNDRFSFIEESPDGPQVRFQKNLTEKFRWRGKSIFTQPDSLTTPIIGDEFLISYRPVMQVVPEYISKLGVDWAEEGAGVINLSVNGTTPAKEIEFLNCLIKNYQAFDLENKNQKAERTIKFIRAQLVGITDSLRFFEADLEKFKKTNNTAGDLSSDAKRVYVQLDELNARKGELMIRSRYFKYLKSYLADNKDFEKLILPNSLGIKEPILENLILDMIKTQSELKMFGASEKAINPIAERRKEHLADTYRQILGSLATLQSNDNILLEEISGNLKEVDKLISYLPLAQRKLVSIQRNYSLQENLYVFLRQRLSEAEISQAGNVTDISIVNPAMQSGGFISPKISQTYLLAFLLGIGIPISILALIELLNSKVRSKEEIEKYTSVPIIGVVGHKQSANNLEILGFPQSTIAESFRLVRTNLSFFTKQLDKATILISSSVSGEGKTFTSINLASIVALSGKRTLVVGADLRLPKLAQEFNLDNNIGLSNFLIGASNFDSIVQKTTYANLDVIGSGPIPPNPSELLLTTRLADFLSLAKQHYDFVIIDTAPMAIVTDAFALMPFVDHTIYVVRQNYTLRSFLAQLQENFETGKIKGVSILFNDVAKPLNRYGYFYRYNYRYYKGYTSS